MIANSMQEEFDAIVIGSGIGGLTTAAILSKLFHKKVLVLEQHFTAGGFTHGFKRKGKFHWDVGLHYVGEMGKGQLGRVIFDYLSNGTLKWQKMPDLMEKFVYPDFTFDVYADPKRYQADLIAKFPQECKAIQQYFKDVQTATIWFIVNSFIELFPSWLQSIVRRGVQYFGAIARQTTQAYLDKNFQDPKLKAVLASQWGDYGLPPSQSCFGIHANIVTHFFEGGWYPVGGGTAIAQSIIPIIEQNGGQVITQRRVTEILIEDGVAVGTKVQHAAHLETEAEIYHAPVIVSDAGAYNTYLKLISPTVPVPHRELIQQFPKGSTIATVYLGLNNSPQTLDFQGENHWIYKSYNHEEVDQTDLIASVQVPKLAYLSFPSLKNSRATAHTAEIIGSIDYDLFSEWQNQPWRKRGAEYTDLKAQITGSLINLVESYYPGFQDLIEYSELSTPLTVEHFDCSDRGTIYGIPCTPARLDLHWIASKTPIKNLYLTGTDAFSPGIVGAMMGGVKTAGIIDGALGFFKIMAMAIMNKVPKFLTLD